MFSLEELTKEGLSGWPLAFVFVVGVLLLFSIVVAFLTGYWPWEGIIHKTYVCKCKSKNCPCKKDDDDEEDED